MWVQVPPWPLLGCRPTVRTAAFGAAYRGSNPCTRTMYPIKDQIIDTTVPESVFENVFLVAFTEGDFVNEVDTFWVRIKIASSFDVSVDALQQQRHTLTRSLSRALIPLIVTSLIVDDEMPEHLRALLVVNGLPVLA